MKSFHLLKITSVILALVTALLACNLPGQTTIATPDLNVIVAQTQTAIAVNQYLTATVPSEAPTSAATPQASTKASNTPPAVLQETPVAPVPTQPPAIIPTSQPPTPTTAPVAESCTNAAKFITETVPDGTSFNPGQQFMKSWTLQNVGTCTWTAEYALVHVNGEQMGGPSPVALGQTVPPGGMIQLYLPQTAPGTTGNYQGYWKLRSKAGQVFGLGTTADVPFWIKISVAPGSDNGGSTFTGPQELGAPSWVESFNDPHSPWYLGTDSGIDYDIENGYLTITTNNPTGDKWRVAQPGFLSDFYLQGNFKTGSACSGKDGYGFIVRAPQKAGYVVDSGYVFSFSCDGKYRVYRIDNGIFEAIQNWTGSAAIKAGPNQPNIMGVYAVGKQFQLYANNILIFKFEDAMYPGGLFGLMVRAETSNFQVHVDEISAWE